MDNNQIRNEGLKSEFKNEVKGRGLFYGVIAVATFIVMAVGATFAYFTATTNSANTSVTTGSTTLQLKYISYEGAWMRDDLIPAATNIVAYSFENQDDTTLNEELGENGNLLCKDDYGNSICSVYVFQVTNSAASPQSVSLNVVSQLNEFTNLAAMAYEVDINGENEDYTTTDGEDGNGSNDPKFKLTGEELDEDLITVLDGNGDPVELGTFTPVYVNRKGVTKTMLKLTEGSETLPAERAMLKQVLDQKNNTEENITERTTKVANNFEISGGETKTYALVLYILESGGDQTELDADKNFIGQVIISSGDGKTGVSGIIRAAVKEPEDEGTEE